MSAFSVYADLCTVDLFQIQIVIVHRHGGYNVGVLQRYYNCVLHHTDRVDSGPIRCYMLPHGNCQAALVEVSEQYFFLSCRETKLLSQKLKLQNKNNTFIIELNVFRFEIAVKLSLHRGSRKTMSINECPNAI